MKRLMAAYGRVAWGYDAVAFGYSLGAIGRAKGWHVGRVLAGERVLFVGAGTGREVARLCAFHDSKVKRSADDSGAQAIEVVCLEPCGAMARRLRRRLSRWSDRVTIVEEPLRAAAGPGTYDWVCGHFFFNVFGVDEMPGVLAMAGSHVKVGGRLVVADFSAAGLAHAMYYRPVNVAGWGLGMCALHPIYDYGPAMEGMGFVVEERESFGLFGGWGRFYEVVCGRKGLGGRKEQGD